MMSYTCITTRKSYNDSSLLVFSRSQWLQHRPYHLGYGLPQRRFPGVRGGSSALPGDGRGHGYPGSSAPASHESPPVLQRPAGGSVQTLAPRIPGRRKLERPQPVHRKFHPPAAAPSVVDDLAAPRSGAAGVPAVDGVTCFRFGRGMRRRRHVAPGAAARPCRHFRRRAHERPHPVADDGERGAFHGQCG